MTFGKITVLGIMLVSTAFAGTSVGDSDKTTELAGSVKDTRGLRFSVPDDWPIERVGNTIGPISIEDYMSRKFAAVNEKLDKQQETITALEKRVEDVERRKRLGA